MWNKIDNQLNKYLKNYKKEQIYLKDQLQDIFTIYLKDDLFKYANEDILRRFKKYLEVNKSIIPKNSYVAYLLSKYANKKNLKLSEIIDLIIRIEYLKFYDRLNRNETILKCGEIAYEEAVGECIKLKKKRHIMPFDYIVWHILSMPNSMGYIYAEYLMDKCNKEAYDVYKQVVIDKQRGKQPNIKDYEQIFKRQQKDELNIKDGKVSGSYENEIDNVVNQVKLEVGNQYRIEKCRFIGVNDKKQTKMCHSLNNKVFYLNKMNKYDRYSAIDDKIVRYETMGMVLGENLPPITNHFHYCRSTITYQLEVENEEN